MVPPTHVLVIGEFRNGIRAEWDHYSVTEVSFQPMSYHHGSSVVRRFSTRERYRRLVKFDLLENTNFSSDWSYIVSNEVKIVELAHTVKNSIWKRGYVVVTDLQFCKFVEIRETAVWQFDQTIVPNTKVLQSCESTDWTWKMRVESFEWSAKQDCCWRCV